MATRRMRRAGGGGAAALRAPVWAILAAGILCLAGCKGGSNTASDNLKSVAITPASATVPLGGTQTFTATINLVNPSTYTTTSVSWEINGVAGGSPTSNVGSITPTSVDNTVAIYQSPSTNPQSTITITAVVTQTNSTATTAPTVTSNSATITLGQGAGLTMTPTGATVAAGGSQNFRAFVNGLPDSAATWSVSSASGITDSSVIGSITSLGNGTASYAAPASPPPGGTVTVTATDGTSQVSATVSIVYSDYSLSGPYAFSYTGNDADGFLDAAGSFVADGNGHITGVEDEDSFLNGLDEGIQITGTYSVSSDGRGTATITRGSAQEIWAFALTSGQHATLTLAEPNATAGGTIDQQSVNAISISPSMIDVPYVFRALGENGRSPAGTSTALTPRAMAGEFTADGLGGSAGAGAIINVNDNGTASPDDTTLSVSYNIDTTHTGSGRGTITFTSNSLGSKSRTFAFYAVGTALDSSNNAYVTQMHLVEIDGIDSMAGDMFSAPPSSALGNGYLSPANYVFTYGGTSKNGAYAAGGILASDGNGNVTSGVLDINDAGTTTLNTTISNCTSQLDATKRRIDLTCTAGSSTPKFAVYQTSLGSAVMLELDSAAVATGTAYEQCGIGGAGCANSTPALSAKSLALGLIGQGVFYSSPSSYQQNIDGQISQGASASTPGTIDIAGYPQPFTSDPISQVTLGTASSLGRGTTVLTANNPSATYNLIYYLIDDKTTLVLDSDKTFVLRGSLGQQY